VIFYMQIEPFVRRRGSVLVSWTASSQENGAIRWLRADTLVGFAFEY